MTDKMTVKLTGGVLGVRGDKTYRKGDILEIDKNPEELKGALKHAFMAGRLVPVEITMNAMPIVKAEPEDKPYTENVKSSPDPDTKKKKGKK